MFAHKEYLSRFSRVSGTGNHSVGDIYVCDRRRDRLPQASVGRRKLSRMWVLWKSTANSTPAGGGGLVIELQFTKIKLIRVADLG